MNVIAFPYTKKRIVDVKRSDDVFDREYGTRLFSISTSRGSPKQEFIDLLRDYEEFLPSGTQGLQGVTDENFRKLFTAIHTMISTLRVNAPIDAAPTVALIITQPPMIVMPRAFATTQTQETRKHTTWGDAFLSLVSAGMVHKIEQQGEKMFSDIEKYKHIAREL